MPAWILEVQRYTNLNGIIGFEHVGYMNKIFQTRKEAIEYYDRNNTEMRSINAHDTLCSDWHPTTKLRYVVRPYHYEILTVAAL